VGLAVSKLAVNKDERAYSSALISRRRECHRRICRPLEVGQAGTAQDFGYFDKSVLP
jgi:hypothetical protein